MRSLLLASFMLLAGCAPPTTGIGEDEPSEGSSSALEARTLTIRPDHVLANGFVGLGAQYNQNLYSNASRDLDGVSTANLPTLEKKLATLDPSYVRIFYDGAAAPDEQASFVKTVALAEAVRATINITYWHGPYTDPASQMHAFAEALAGLLVQPNAPSTFDITIQNEVNTTPCVTEEVYAALYVALYQDLHARGIRHRFRFIGGDLLRGGNASEDPGAFDARVAQCMKQCGYTKAQCDDKEQANASTQEAWLQDFATRPVVNVDGAKVLSDMFAGYSAHIYWDYWDRTKMIDRLDGLQKAIDALPANARKPLYITEFGARGVATDAQLAPGVTTDAHHALDADGHQYVASNGYPVAKTYIEAFQTGRFVVEALKRGVVATARWDAFDARYQEAPMGVFSMLSNGKSNWAETPSFAVQTILDEGSVPGWNVVGVDGDESKGVVAAALAGPDGGRSLFVANDTNALQKLMVHGLPKKRALHVAVWNRTKGQEESSVSSDGTGTTSLDVPVHGIAVLTTAPPH